MHQRAPSKTQQLHFHAAGVTRGVVFGRYKWTQAEIIMEDIKLWQKVKMRTCVNQKTKKKIETLKLIYQTNNIKNDFNDISLS